MPDRRICGERHPLGGVCDLLSGHDGHHWSSKQGMAWGFPDEPIADAPAGEPGSWKRLAMQALRYLNAEQIAEVARAAGAQVNICTDSDSIATALALGEPPAAPPVTETPWVGLVHLVDAALAMHRQDERITLSRQLVMELRACAVALIASRAPTDAR